jgi:hypothetical protein
VGKEIATKERDHVMQNSKMKACAAPLAHSRIDGGLLKKQEISRSLAFRHRDGFRQLLVLSDTV